MTKQGQLPGPAPRCPQCMAKLDGWTAMDDLAEPKHGDATVCIYCGAVGVFVMTPLGMLMRPPTNAERADIERHPDIVAAHSVARLYQWNRGPR